jgi:hypothetical protein
LFFKEFEEVNAVIAGNCHDCNVVFPDYRQDVIQFHQVLLGLHEEFKVLGIPTENSFMVEESAIGEESFFKQTLQIDWDML